jgi:hypothetical protein
MVDVVQWLISIQGALWGAAAALVVAIGGLFWSDAVQRRWSGPPYRPWTPGSRPRAA